MNPSDPWHFPGSTPNCEAHYEDGWLKVITRRQIKRGETLEVATMKAKRQQGYTTTLCGGNIMVFFWYPPSKRRIRKSWCDAIKFD